MKQTISALNDTLLRLSRQNKDAALIPLITDALAHSQSLQKLHTGMALSEKTTPPSVVDAKVFQRLLALAGPETAVELLNQLLIDLSDAQRTLGVAATAYDWPAVRKACHVLVAIAGSIGANHVMTSAQSLHKAVQRADKDAVATETTILLHLLKALIAFVHDQCSATGARP